MAEPGVSWSLSGDIPGWGCRKSRQDQGGLWSLWELQALGQGSELVREGLQGTWQCPSLGPAVSPAGSGVQRWLCCCSSQLT